MIKVFIYKVYHVNVVSKELVEVHNYENVQNDQVDPDEGIGNKGLDIKVDVVYQDKEVKNISHRINLKVNLKVERKEKEINLDILSQILVDIDNSCMNKNIVHVSRYL